MTRLLLFILAALFSLWIGLFWFGEGTIHKAVIYLGYPSIFVSFALFLWGIFDLHRKEFNLKNLLPRKKEAYIAILLVSGLLLLFEPFDFKIVFDEVILSLSGQFLHFNRLSGVPREANDYLGSYLLMDSILDKRPFFFPFLLSIVHDFSGYRFQNAFFLNGVLTVLLVSLVYIISRIFSGHRGGLLAVLLTGTLPLLSVFASSGHFEILNLVMILLVILFSMIYLENPNEKRLVPLVFALILLCQVRYENCLYLLPFGILILLGWKKAGRCLLSIPIILSPLFLILYTVQFRMIHSADYSFFQAGPNGRVDTFSLSYAKENLVSAMNFFFSTGQGQPNSYLLSVFGISSIFAFCYWAFRRSKFLSGLDYKGTTVYYFLIASAISSLVIVFFNFGMLDRYVTNRLSLPIHLLFILLTPFVFRRLGRTYIVMTLLFGLLAAFMTYSGFDKKTILSSGILFAVVFLSFVGGMFWLWKYSRHPRTALLFVPGIYILTVVMPIGHAHRYSEKYMSNDIIIEEINFIKERQDEEKMLFVAGHQYSAMLTMTNTTFIDILAAYPHVAYMHLQSRIYNSIYVSRRFERDDEGVFNLVNENEYLDPEIFILEPVYVKPLTTAVYMEISRLVEVVMPEDDAG